MSDLDKDFNTIVKQINVKLNEAAASLKEANMLRTQVGLPAFIVSQWNRDEMYDAIGKLLSPEELEKELESFYGEKIDKDSEEYDDIVGDFMYEKAEEIMAFDVGALETQINDAGWSTSSSYC